VLGTEASFEGAHLLLDIIVRLIGKATLFARGRFLISLHDFPNVVGCTFSGPPLSRAQNTQTFVQRSHSPNMPRRWPIFQALRSIFDACANRPERPALPCRLVPSVAVGGGPRAARAFPKTLLQHAIAGKAYAALMRATSTTPSSQSLTVETTIGEVGNFPSRNLISIRHLWLYY
jgi:hypothetical protein